MTATLLEMQNVTKCKINAVKSNVQVVCLKIVIKKHLWCKSMNCCVAATLTFRCSDNLQRLSFHMLPCLIKRLNRNDTIKLCFGD